VEKELRDILFAAFAALLLIALIGTLLGDYLRARRAARATWEDLLKGLTWVDRDKVAKIALDAIAESGEPRRDENSFTLDSSAIWDLLGGLEGLEVLEKNCHVLVELASYVQKWYPEALVAAEQLRLNAREIEWHIGRLKAAARTGNLQSSFADYAQRATVIYYLMARNVLTLYEQASLPGLADLQRAL
jgi:hypothetical protein